MQLMQESCVVLGNLSIEAVSIKIDLRTGDLMPASGDASKTDEPAGEKDEVVTPEMQQQGSTSPEEHSSKSREYT